MNPNDLPLYTAAQVRELDRITMEAQGIPAYTLMCRAGAAAFAALRERWPASHRLTLLCGLGNNAGDGYVVARLAREAGLAVQVYYLADPQQLQGAAARAWQAAAGAGVQAQAYAGGGLMDAGIVVDAILGTGLSRPVTGPWRRAIEAVNACGAPVLALDVPSGLCADTGSQQGVAVRATATVTFIGRKRGLFTGDGPECAGRVIYAALAVPDPVFRKLPVDTHLMQAAALGSLARPRPRNAHKGHHGHVLVVGGAPGYAGAVRLAGEAAARVGAGLVSIATHPDHAAIIASQRPELMSHAVAQAADIMPLLARASVIAVGPGLGLQAWARDLFAQLLQCKQPMVVDADALSLLAAEPVKNEHWILTPHPGEAGRLLGCTTSEVQADRFAAAREINQRYGGCCVLKGSGSLLAMTGQPAYVCGSGNPGMAGGGMGDVLTGVIAGLLAQGLCPWDAARAGTWVHGRAGDLAAGAHERGLLATDLISGLRALVNP